MPNEKVSGHAHTEKGDAASASHLNGDDSQGDRDASLTLKHLVDVAIRWVVIVIFVSTETLFLKQELDDTGKRSVRDFLSKMIDLE
jgi:hypothetical protein